MNSYDHHSDVGPAGEAEADHRPQSNQPFPEMETEALGSVPPDEGGSAGSRASVGSIWGAVRESPRGLLLLWCLWLLGSWLASLWQSSSASIVAVRLMVFVSAAGLMLIWPLFRLSETPPRRDDFKKDSKLSKYVVLEPPKWATREAVITPGLMIFSDWLTLILVFQAVVWPLRLTAGWTVQQTAWLDLTVVVWSFLIAAVVAIVCRTSKTGVRTFGMIVCVLLVFGEPALMLLANLYNGQPVYWQMQATPIAPMWAMSALPLDWKPEPWKAGVLVIGAASLVAWLMVILLRRQQVVDALRTEPEWSNAQQP